MEHKNELERKFRQLIERYITGRPKSHNLNSRACSFLPDGDTRTATFFEPYPPYIARGEGSYVFDVDGNRYIDYMNNYTSLIHGHNHPKIREAVMEQLNCGTIFGAPHESQCALAEILCGRVPSMQRIRFCNSGTEATMFAIRAARAYTGKDKIIKMEGGYHGTHDLVMASVLPSMNEAGDAAFPNIISYSKGIPKNVFSDLSVVPFNNREAAQAAIEACGNDVAAIIIEPVMGSAGMIPALRDYLSFLRDITSKKGILLIFDEIISFRLARGGAQEWFGIEPDLTALGKIIGGGFPVGAFGGREDIMSLFSPRGGTLPQSGTFTGHPITMVAGAVALKEMTQEVYTRINSLGDVLRNGIDEIFTELGLKASTSGVGSLVFIHYTSDRIRDYRDARKASESTRLLKEIVNFCFLDHGIFFAARGQFSISTPMTRDLINETIGSIRESFSELKPFIETCFPHLVDR